MVLQFLKALVRTLEATMSQIGNQHGHFSASWQGCSKSNPDSEQTPPGDRHRAVSNPDSIDTDRLQFKPSIGPKWQIQVVAFRLRPTEAIC
jgi:hypothetical protein